MPVTGSEANRRASLASAHSGQRLANEVETSIGDLHHILPPERLSSGRGASERRTTMGCCVAADRVKVRGRGRARLCALLVLSVW